MDDGGKKQNTVSKNVLEVAELQKSFTGLYKKKKSLSNNYG